jgi:hypothetical protein
MEPVIEAASTVAGSGISIMQGRLPQRPSFEAREKAPARIRQPGSCLPPLARDVLGGRPDLNATGRSSRPVY